MRLKQTLDQFSKVAELVLNGLDRAIDGDELQVEVMAMNRLFEQFNSNANARPFVFIERDVDESPSAARINSAFSLVKRAGRESEFTVALYEGATHLYFAASAKDLAEEICNSLYLAYGHMGVSAIVAEGGINLISPLISTPERLRADLASAKRILN